MVTLQDLQGKAVGSISGVKMKQGDLKKDAKKR